MIADIIDKLKKLFKIKSINKTELEQIDELGYVNKYEDVTEFNIVSIIANKLANLVCSEAAAEVAGDDFLDNCLQKFAAKLHLITARAFGTGGVVLKPYIFNGDIYTDIIPQNRFFVIERHGEVITKAGFIADVYSDAGKKKKYVRFECHSLDSGGVYTIENKAVAIEDKEKEKKKTDGEEIRLSEIPVWSDIPERVDISNVGQMLFAFVKCPSDNKKDSGLNDGGTYGVPITYGQDKLIKMILDLLNEIPDEYKNKKAFIGADELLFGKDNKLPQNGLYKLFRASGGVDRQSFWEVFSPEIRNTSYFEGVDYFLGLIEKSIGLNRGILTDLITGNATATEVKYGKFDTEAFADRVHKNLEAALEQLVYAFDVFANAFSLSPSSAEEYKINFDWSNWSEDSTERWAQLMQGQSSGAVNGYELRQYIFDEDKETAIKNMPEQISDMPMIAGE